MIRPKLDIKKILIPSDSLAILVILMGLLIAIFLHEIAIRLIGVSVAILGTVALFMLVSQRISEMVESKHTPRDVPQNFKVTRKKEGGATRTVFEDFSNSFGPEPEPTEKAPPQPDLKKEEEGFRFVSKKDPQQTKIPAEIKAVTSRETQSREFTDEVSGMKIIGKVKTKADDSELVAEQEEKIPEKAEKPQEMVIPPPEKSLTSDTGKAESVEKPAPPKSEDEGKVIIEFRTSHPPQDIPEKKTVQEPAQVRPAPDEKVPIKEEIPSATYKEKAFDVQLNVLMEDLSMLGSEPRKEFEYFLSRVLMVIRSVTNTRTAAFLLINAEKGELILESYVTDVQESITPKHKLQYGNDIISQIYTHKKPEILTDINPAAELDLVPYYTRPVGISSFIGVPVFYNNAVIGVLCADTNVPDAYDSFSVNFFGHFTKLISALVQSYTNKYDLLQDSRTLNAINNLRDIMTDMSKNLDDIVEALVESISTIFDYKTIGVCAFEESQNAWHIRAIRSKDESYKKLLNYPVHLDKALIGKSIMLNKTLLVSPLAGNETRVFNNEPEGKGGFFAGIPIPLRSINSTFGALFVEGSNPGSITSIDLGIMETLCDHAGSNIEKMHFIDMLQSGAMYDNATGMLTPSAFYQRLEEEMNRSSDFKTPFTLCLFQIDKYQSFDPEMYQDRMEKVLMHVFDKVKKLVRPYDLFGRADVNTFAIVLIGARLDNAQVWAEKLRHLIASSVLEIDGKKFNVTISQGIAYSEKTDTTDALIANSRKALNIALEKSNSVMSFV